MNSHLPSRVVSRVVRQWWPVLVFVALVVACLAMLAGSAPAFAQGASPPPAPPSGRPSAARGKELFATNCVPCHGPGGAGDGDTLKAQGKTAPSFSQPAFHSQQSPADIYTIISEGRIANIMPPWKGRLAPDQLWDLAYYAWWLGTGSATLARGQAVWQAECSACHGASGAGVQGVDLSQAGRAITFSQADLADRSMAAKDHAPLWSKLSAADQAAALAYARGLGFDAPAAPVSNGAIRGTIRNATTNTPVTPGQVVSATLYSFVGTAPQAPAAAPVDSQGAFKFEGLTAGEDYNYGVGVLYNGIQYFSPLVRLTADQPTQTPELRVYETTASDPGMRIGQVHVIAEFLDARTLRVGELFEVQNPSQRTFVAPAGGATLEMNLPPGATNIRFQDEEIDATSLRDGNSLRLNMPWIPGSRQVLLAYDLPYNSSLRLSRAWPYPTGEVNVLVEDLGVQVSADGLQTKPAMDTPNGGRYLSLSAPSLAARQVVNLTLSGTPRIDAPAVGSGGPGQAGAAAAVSAARVQTSYQAGLRWLGVLLAGLAALAFLAWPRLRSSSATSGRENLAVTRERLLDQLADLDDAYALGEMGESDYAVQRADTKARLVAAMRALRAQE